MNLLYLSPWFPFPPTNGSELRINALVRGLAAAHRVTLVSFQRRAIDPRGLEEARDLLEDVRLVPWREFNPAGGRARLAFLSPTPRSVVDTYSREFAGCIEQALTRSAVDVVVASQLGTAAYWPTLGAIPALLEEVELAAFHQQAQAPGSATQRARRNLMWAKLRAYVRRLLPHFAACTVVSERERTLLRDLAPGYAAIEVVPNCVDPAAYSGYRVPKDGATLLFTGAFTYGVNYEAMVWFLSEVYPLVRRVVPGARVVITGDHAGLPLPPAENVTLTGYVADVKAVIAGATVSIVPIRQGGGTRLKILEAMALGTPVVSTTKGAEGLAASDGEHLLLGDTPADFAAAVVRLLQDGELRRSLADNAAERVRTAYSWEGVMPRFLAMVERVASRKP